MTKVHDLKVWPAYYDEIESGRLPFSIRNNEGRGFQRGDFVRLREWDPEKPETVGTSKYTGREMQREITYVESSWGVSPGHVVLGFGMPYAVQAAPVPRTGAKPEEPGTYCGNK